MRRIRILALRFVLLCLAACCAPCPAAPPPDPPARAEAPPRPPSPLDGADQRIEALRKGDVALTVLGPDGRPLPGLEVEVRQTRHSFLFGSSIFALFGYPPEQEALYERRFTELLNYGTIAFYWSSYEPEPGKPRPDHPKRTAAWCRERGIVTKGHPLVWYLAYPDWAPREAAEAKPLLERRVKGIVKEFAGLIDRWDVVNEAALAPLKDNGVSRWAKESGRAGLAVEPLVWAREAAPSAFLLYNENDLGRHYRDIAKALKDRRAPVDALGLQSHMHKGAWPLERVWDLCEAYAGFGLPLDWTEITVLSGTPMREDDGDWDSVRPDWATDPEGETRQAEYVAKLYTLLFSHPAVEAITWWDLVDGGWLGAPAGLLRKDLSAKPAYDALLALVKGKWWTRATLRTDARGAVAFRGFGGDYTVSAGGRKASFSVRPRVRNALEVRLE